MINQFIPIIHNRKLIQKNKLAIITSFFNPYNDISLKYNYLLFSHNIKKYATLFPIELSFDGNFFIEDNNAIRINGDKDNILWQKDEQCVENLKEVKDILEK